MKNIGKPVLLLAALVALGVGGPVAASAFANDPTPTPVTTNGATGEQDGANNDLATQVDDQNEVEDQQGVDEQDGENNDLAAQVDTGNNDEQGQDSNDETAGSAPTGTTGPTGDSGQNSND
jgi:hypothetical protein